MRVSHVCVLLGMESWSDGVEPNAGQLLGSGGQPATGLRSAASKPVSGSPPVAVQLTSGSARSDIRWDRAISRCTGSVDFSGGTPHGMDTCWFRGSVHSFGNLWAYSAAS